MRASRRARFYGMKWPGVKGLVGLGLVGAGLVVIMFCGCDRFSSAPDEDIARRHAEIRGQFWGAMVAELSRELVLLHPMSDRGKSGRRARILLDGMEREIVPWPEEEEESMEEE
ncbi:MAG: hypothetical protein ACNA8W_04260 [Bradymonadaceae bacterium]